MITRRSFFGMLAAPAIIKTAGLLMPIKALEVRRGLLPYQQAAADAIMELPPGVYTGKMANFMIQSENAHRAVFEFILVPGDKLMGDEIISSRWSMEL